MIRTLISVKDLIAVLATQDPDAVIVLGNDAEGNQYTPAASITGGFYAAVTSYRGIFYEAGGIWNAADGIPAVSLDPLN